MIIIILLVKYWLHILDKFQYIQPHGLGIVPTYSVESERNMGTIKLAFRPKYLLFIDDLLDVKRRSKKKLN